jgi:hypothetical protein
MVEDPGVSPKNESIPLKVYTASISANVEVRILIEKLFQCCLDA